MELAEKKALVTAIEKGKPAEAGNDAFPEEPVTMDNPLLHVPSEKLLFSPHVAGMTNEAAARIINRAVSNVARVLKGEIPESLIN